MYVYTLRYPMYTYLGGGGGGGGGWNGNREMETEEIEVKTKATDKHNYAISALWSSSKEGRLHLKQSQLQGKASNRWLRYTRYR